MTTPSEPLTQEDYPVFAGEEPSNVPAATPDNPPWGVGLAAILWLASVALMLMMQVAIVVPYFFYARPQINPQTAAQDISGNPTFIFLSIIAIIPAHLLTFALAWALVTGFGKRPFGPTLGLSWGERMGFWKSAGLAVLLLVVGWSIAKLIGGGETQMDQIINSSPAARFATVFLATLTAPIVEETVYRGVLYPAMRRQFGAIVAVVSVATLFTVVHVAQYYNNIGVIAAVTLLGFSVTLVRAYTGRLLPCIVIHTVFNGIQCAALVYDYYWPISREETKTGLFVLARQTFQLIS